MNYTNLDNPLFITFQKAVEHKITDECFKMSKPDPLGLNVLNHGDFWSNNMMFSHDESGNIKETILVDYQMPKYGTVAQDLLYFLMSSTKLEDKLSKFDYYIKFYHDNLVKHLKLLNYTETIPTLRGIHTSLFKYGFWGKTTDLLNNMFSLLILYFRFKVTLLQPELWLLFW